MHTRFHGLQCIYQEWPTRYNSSVFRLCLIQQDLPYTHFSLLLAKYGKRYLRILQDMWYLSVDQALNLTPLRSAKASANSGEALHSHLYGFPISPPSYQQDYAGFV